MRFQIREVILWPRKQGQEPRRLRFQLGAVNVISGVSKTGKSAIIPIIDYCLGSEKCSIPVKTIRDACSWFGLIVQTDDGQKLFARREPGVQQSTGDMFVIEGPEVAPPLSIDGRNTSVDAVKESLNQLAGLTQLNFSPEGAVEGFKDRPSFRDMAAFNFQPQNVVANPNTLFYKADTHEHREKLRIIFPYVLGAVTPDVLAKQHQLIRLQAELRRKEREFESIRQVSARWFAEVQSKISRARELGLLTAEVPHDASLGRIIEMLRRVAEESSRDLRPSAESISGAVRELVELQNEEGTESSHLSHLRRRLSDMTRLRETSSQYRNALSIKRDRLKIAEWMRSLAVAQHECPLCGSSDAPATDEIQTLYQALKETEGQAGDFERLPAAFDREYERIRQDIETSADKLEAIRIRRRALEGVSKESRDQQYSMTASSHFLGGLEEALQRYDSLAIDSDLAEELVELRDRISQLQSELREHDVKSALERALHRISVSAGRLLPELDVERPDDPIALSIDDLTIRVASPDREDYLWEIGSGANWLGYHVAVSLALQSLFLGLPHSPVPSFLVYDQPSQVYFPMSIHGLSNELDQEFDAASSMRDEDVEAVRKVFKVLSDATRSASGQLQAIVLDHAPSIVWRGLPNVELVEEWRFGKKLVPSAWL